MLYLVLRLRGGCGDRFALTCAASVIEGGLVSVRVDVGRLFVNTAEYWLDTGPLTGDGPGVREADAAMRAFAARVLDTFAAPALEVEVIDAAGGSVPLPGTISFAVFNDGTAPYGRVALALSVNATFESKTPVAPDSVLRINAARLLGVLCDELHRGTDPAELAAVTADTLRDMDGSSVAVATLHLSGETSRSQHFANW